MDDNFSAKLEEVKSRTDIVEVISQYLSLKKAGRNYLGLCPFHQEKTPSFSVNPEKQFFHCFGCGKSGDVITFLMEIEQLSYMEAMWRLARRLGVSLPQRPTGVGTTTLTKEKLLVINRLASAFFTKNLGSTAAKPAREYLEKRSLAPEIATAFRLGFAHDSWQNLKNHLERANVPLTDALTVGLLSQRDDGGYYDKFRNRLIFPIHGVGGDIIAFGGRIIDIGKPKYLNSPESPIYNKGSNLYGLFQSRAQIAEAGFAVVVEGYMDLLTLWTAGIRNVVAMLGTALTETQVRLLKRYCSNVCVLFDGDSAGQRAMVRSWELFTTGGIEAKAVVLPENKDPDDFVKAYGAEALREKLIKADLLSDYFFHSTIGKAQGAAQINAAIRAVAPLLAGIGDEIARGIFIHGIVEKSGVSKAVLLREIAASQQKTPDAHAQKNEKPASLPLREFLDNWEVDILRIMAEFPSVIEIVDAEAILPLFTTEYLKNIGEMIISNYKITGRVDVIAMLHRLDDDELRDALMKHIIAGAPCEKENSKQTALDIIRSIKKRDCRRQFRELSLKLTEVEKAGDAIQAAAILSQLQEIKEQEKTIASR